MDKPTRNGSVRSSLSASEALAILVEFYGAQDTLGPLTYVTPLSTVSKRHLGMKVRCLILLTFLDSNPGVARVARAFISSSESYVYSDNYAEWTTVYSKHEQSDTRIDS